MTLPSNVAAAVSSGRGDLVLVGGNDPWTSAEQEAVKLLLVDLINTRAELRLADHHLRDVILEHRRSLNGNLDRLEEAVTRMAKAVEGER